MRSLLDTSFDCRFCHSLYKAETQSRHGLSSVARQYFDTILVFFFFIKFCAKFKTTVKMYARLLVCAVILMLAVNQAIAAMSMEQIQKTAQTIRNTCTTKTHADPGAVAGIQNGAFPDDDQTLKCYTLCIMKTMRTFKNGRIDEGMMIKQMDLMMPAEMAEPLKVTAAKCSAEPPAGDDCETTYQFVKCSYQTDSDHFFFP